MSYETCTLFDDVLHWSRTTFPSATTESVREHLRREIQEFWLKPTDVEEIADIVFFLIQLAHNEGHDLHQAIQRKLDINKARVWETPDAFGVIEHVQEQQELCP